MHFLTHFLELLRASICDRLLAAGCCWLLLAAACLPAFGHQVFGGVGGPAKRIQFANVNSATATVR